MWLFLLTEVMFFGGLFTAYLILRNWYYPAFVEGSHQLSIGWGTANTAVLITSSFTHGHGRVVRGDAAQRSAGADSGAYACSWAWCFSASRPLSTQEKMGKASRSGLPLQRAVVSRSCLGPGGLQGIPRQAAGAGHGAAHGALFLPLLCHDRHARAAHDHRHRDSWAS